ncbi:unnamed protein product [Pneumocystis jirovecii]|uniref:RCC1-like domain-containing protein n=2 Tax=Pneumocystis jirovecii TaxID=42068 RepID=L0P9Z5_PNEJI|nr:uncharacterized protein T551_02458 [Pneumocystis jirovecii RU7]KTW28608.1 hypothetical protein T551_02458 [Pneumocystis jirovecii RU7]CCJ29231.1 unnamed protein product [Pneumocystis jirovecii]
MGPSMAYHRETRQGASKVNQVLRKTMKSYGDLKKQSQIQGGTLNAAKKINDIGKLKGKKSIISTRPQALKGMRSHRSSVPFINEIPVLKQQKLCVYVFGTGSMSELGLGPEPTGRVVKRPRLNPLLPYDTIGIVDVAVGGMHTAAIDYEGNVYTWGVNDQGALGRDTTWDVNRADLDSDDEQMLNPKDSVPGKVEGMPDGVKVVKMACGDSISVAITDKGQVYAWGSFRCSDGILGFSPQIKIARQPVHLKELNNIVSVVCGTDHVLALTAYGSVFSWGNGQQFQLGHRVVERTRLNALVPREFGLKKIKAIGAGSYHSFAISHDGRVFSWGLNQFGQCGIESSGGEDGAVVSSPTHVQSLDPYNIVCITGGEHHSAALTQEGELLVWGRLDANQLGIPRTYLPQYTIYDASNRPRFVPIPTKVPGIPIISQIYCGTHHNLAITKDDGSVWSWGFGESYQVGQGPSGNDVEVPTKIDNTAIRGKVIVAGGAGGQFSVLLGIPSVES